MKVTFAFFVVICFILATSSCKTNNGKSQNNTADGEIITVPDFNADSAYNFVKAQVEFGPRVPNTKAHRECGEYLAGKLEEFGATVTNQYVDLIAYDGTILKARNIIGSYNPENKKRILLFAHWDSRPWADQDPDKQNYHTPILGANDGASGVGVLLEIARLINMEAPRLGIDIIFFDAEDYGEPSFETVHRGENYALGSQYWSKYPHVQNYNARFGILLDMVGGKNAVFYKEGYSEQYAKNINKKVWTHARELGHGKYFVDVKGGYVTDDHLYINRNIGIPSIDIIPFNFSEEGSHWHTLNDNMDNIDENTLRVVGQTVMAVIYNEK